MTLTDHPNHLPILLKRGVALGWRWLWLVALLGGTIASARADITEQEPNDSRSVANPLPLDAGNQGQVTSAKIATLSDVDYFKITTPAISGPLSLTLTMTPTSGDHDLDAKLELEDASGPLTARGTLLDSQDSHSDNGPETLSVAVSGDTTYYVRCTSADLFSSGSGDYTLSVRVAVPQIILSAYWLAPNHVTEGTVATLRAQVTGFQLGDPFVFEIREDDGLLGSDSVTTVSGNVYASDGGLFVDATWPTVWMSDQSGDPEYYFIVSHGTLSRQSGTGDADEMHVAISDRDDQIGEAIVLGPMTQTRSFGGEISSPTDTALYSFTVTAGQRVSFDTDRPTGALASYLRVFDAKGNELAHNAGGAGPGEVAGTEAYVEYAFTTAGTYYVGVSGVGNEAYDAVSGDGDADGSTGAYTLVLSPGIAGTIRRPDDTTDYQVDILRYGTNPAPIDTSLRTWIVIHGWMSSRTNQNIAEAAASLAAARPDDQILTLDWRAADTSVFDPFDAESSIVPVAQWAAAALAGYGFHGTNLNLVGHSFGSYVADELAERIGGVDTIVVLDPAVNIPGGFDPEDSGEVNFARDSLFSWAFHSSLLGSTESPVTADEAFVVDSDQDDPVAEHGDAVYLFTYLLTHPTGGVGQYFLLPRLLAGILGPWIPDQYSTHFTGESSTGGYEADIVTTGTGEGLVAQSIDFKPAPARTGVSGSGVTILDGDTTPSVTDGTDFASVPQGEAGPTRTFTVRNDGGSVLTLGAPSFPAGFSLVGLFPATVAAGDSASFTVRLDTSAPGTFSGKVSFPHDGDGGSSFSFTITGTVLPPPAPPVLTLLAGPTLTLQVAGDVGATYTIEFTATLAGTPDWQPVKTLASGESWTPPAETEQGFFRVQVP